MGKARKKEKNVFCNTQVALAEKLDQQMLSLGHHCLVNLSHSPNLWMLSTCKLEPSYGFWIAVRTRHRLPESLLLLLLSTTLKKNPILVPNIPALR